MNHLNSELSSCLILLITGIFMGGFFDLYRVFRSTVKVNRFIDLIGDLFFWISALFMISPLIYWGTWLELRFYVWILIITGLTIYFWSFSKLLIPFYLRFWRVMSWFPKCIIKNFWRIWLWVRKVIWQTFYKS